MYAEVAHMTRIASSSDLSSARAWICVVEDFQHPTLLLAYETVFTLLLPVRIGRVNGIFLISTSPPTPQP